MVHQEPFSENHRHRMNRQYFVLEMRLQDVLQLHIPNLFVSLDTGGTPRFARRFRLGIFFFLQKSPYLSNCMVEQQNDQVGNALW